jgi:tRNA pseudouridine55 synthase
MHAVVNVDKPAGLTSRRAMEHARRVLETRKAGHAGTLDPMATGVLLVCLGEATKISGYLAELEKEYSATLKLGERTDTFDAEGKTTHKVEDFMVTRAEVEEILESFRGDIEQVPPMYSAVKQAGKPLYKLARKGLEVERKPRQVRISDIELLKFDSPLIQIRITCSKGTYIRTLADDIGTALGPGAHITALRRLRVGHFTADEAALTEELHEGHGAVHTIDLALKHLQEIVLTPEEYALAVNGVPFSRNAAVSLCQSTLLRLKDPHENIFAVGAVYGKKIRVRRLLNLKS